MERTSPAVWEGQDRALGHSNSRAPKLTQAEGQVESWYREEGLPERMGALQ